MSSGQGNTPGILLYFCRSLEDMQNFMKIESRENFMIHGMESGIKGTKSGIGDPEA